MIFDDVAEEMLSAFAQKSSRSSRSRRRRSSSSSSSSSHRKKKKEETTTTTTKKKKMMMTIMKIPVCLLGANLSSEKRTKNQKTRTLGLASTNRTLRLCPRDTQSS